MVKKCFECTSTQHSEYEYITHYHLQFIIKHRGMNTFILSSDSAGFVYPLLFTQTPISNNFIPTFVTHYCQIFKNPSIYYILYHQMNHVI